MFSTGDILKTTGWSRSNLQKMIRGGFILSQGGDSSVISDKFEEGKNRQFSWHTVVCANTISWGAKLGIPLDAAKEAAWSFAYTGGAVAYWEGDEEPINRAPAALFDDNETFLVWRRLQDGNYYSSILNEPPEIGADGLFSLTHRLDVDPVIDGMTVLRLFVPMDSLASQLGVPRSVIYGGRADR
ncbi:MAG: hypothetical protein AAF580_10120 [Pseudomonadota bacterium]